jgi:glycosyltransferase involved in cell wall biosynthesis
MPGQPMINFHVHQVRAGSFGASEDFEKMLGLLVLATVGEANLVFLNPGDWGIDVLVGDRGRTERVNDVVLDARHRVPSGISVYGVATARSLAPLLVRRGLTPRIVVEDHQRASFPPDVIVAPHTEHYVHFDNQLAELVGRIAPQHVHSFGPLVDPRWAPSYSVTWHDVMRLEFSGLRYPDSEVIRRTGSAELARMAAFVEWCGAQWGDRHAYGSMHEQVLAWYSDVAGHRATFVVTVSATSAKKLVERWHYSGDVQIVRPQVRQLTPDAKMRQQLCQVPPFLFFVGAPDEHKRLDLFCSALWAHPEGRALRVVVVGTAADETLDFRLRHHSTARVLRDPRIHRLGRVSDDVLASLYTTALATVVPSLAEGYCLPAAECASLGGRVLANDLEVLQETLRGYSGVVWFRMDDPASAIRGLRRIRLAAAASRQVRPLVPDPQVKHTELVALADRIAEACRRARLSTEDVEDHVEGSPG